MSKAERIHEKLDKISNKIMGGHPQTELLIKKYYSLIGVLLIVEGVQW